MHRNTFVPAASFESVDHVITPVFGSIEIPPDLSMPPSNSNTVPSVSVNTVCP